MEPDVGLRPAGCVNLDHAVTIAIIADHIEVNIADHLLSTPFHLGSVDLAAPMALFLLMAVDRDVAAPQARRPLNTTFMALISHA